MAADGIVVVSQYLKNSLLDSFIQRKPVQSPITMRFNSLLTILAVFTATGLAIECGVDSECDQTSTKCYCNGRKDFGPS